MTASGFLDTTTTNSIISDWYAHVFPKTCTHSLYHHPLAATVCCVPLGWCGISVASLWPLLHFLSLMQTIIFSKKRKLLVKSRQYDVIDCQLKINHGEMLVAQSQIQ